MPDLPTGTVTFLFTDIEGSTRLWEEQREAMASALARHDAILRAAIESHGGVVFKTVGDAFCAAFADPAAAARAALAAQVALIAVAAGGSGSEASERTMGLRVRMAIETGFADAVDGDYVGPTLNRVARLLSLAHGEQVLVSGVTEALLTGYLDEGVGSLDLGEHRLRDISRAVRVHQLTASGMPTSFPPLDAADAVRGNLPAQLSSFVGRAPELDDLVTRLREHRLVSLVGVGGTGKTRLALEAAATAAGDYGDGTWFVDLAPVADPARVVQAAVDAVGARDTGAEAVDGLITHVRGWRALVILDNCEHVLLAAADLAAALVGGCPGLRVLCTSREPLGVPGEAVTPLGSLELPGPEDVRRAGAEVVEVVSRYDAVRLFVERATSASPSFAVDSRNAAAIATVCSRLDGIPLALELAAARVPSLSPEQIARRLDDRFRLLTGGSRVALPRHQTLRAAIDWSYDGLGEAERRVLARSSVFAGAVPLEEVEAVCGFEPVDELDVVDALASLVSKSLVVAVHREMTRYRLLHTIRAYAAEKVGAEESQLARERQLAWYRAWIAGFGVERYGLKADDAVREIDGQSEDLRQAVEWGLVQPSAVEATVGLLAQSWWFWTQRSRSENAALFDRAAAAWAASRGPEPSGLGTTAAEAPRYFTYARAILLRATGRLDRAIALYGDVRRAAALVGDLRLEAWAVQDAGASYQVAGRPDQGEAMLLEALELKVRLGDPSEEAVTQVNLGEVLRARGELPGARQRYERAHELLEGEDSESSLAFMVHHNLGWVLARLGIPQEGRRAFARAARLAGSDPIMVALCLAGFAGTCEAREGLHAARLLGAARAVLQLEGLRPEPTDLVDWEWAEARLRGEVDPEAWAASEAEGAAMKREEAVALAEQGALRAAT
jgi:predicted ATPase/class 3 adenylate cyclase